MTNLHAPTSRRVARIRPLKASRCGFPEDRARRPQPPCALLPRHDRCESTRPPSIPTRRRPRGCEMRLRLAAPRTSAGPGSRRSNCDRSADGAGNPGRRWRSPGSLSCNEDRSWSCQTPQHGCSWAGQCLGLSSQPNSALPRMREPAATVSEPAFSSPLNTPVCSSSTREEASMLPSS
jgi:hypothetical protein